MYKPTVGLLLIFFALSCNNSDSGPAAGTASEAATAAAPATINYNVVNAFPHDTTSYTEGFLVHDGQLYESTGFDSTYGSTRSLFGTVDLKTGKIQTKVEIDRKKYFGEGIVFLHGKVYQLTYKTKVGFVYDAKTFKKLGEFTFLSAEGWGMTTDGTNLIMTDGTSNISYLDPNTFRLVRVLGVSDNNGPVNNLNEPELINGFLYTNQYLSNYIFKIDTASGKVVGRMDLSSLDSEAKNKYPDALQLNGIAFDSASKKVYITGKLWPNIYQLQFAH